MMRPWMAAADRRVPSAPRRAIAWHGKAIEGDRKGNESIPACGDEAREVAQHPRAFAEWSDARERLLRERVELRA